MFGLKKILFQDLAVTNKSKEKAEKISKIAFALQSCINVDKGDLEIWKNREVVEDGKVENEISQISLSDALLISCNCFVNSSIRFNLSCSISSLVGLQASM